MSHEQIANQLGPYIIQQSNWELLPPHIKKLVGNSPETWKLQVIRYSLRHQLRWKNSLVRRFLTDEKIYYLELLRICKSNLMLYPYQLSDVMVLGLRVPPFLYYLEMMTDIMINDKSYDVLPNFTAADCIRILGIGRNQYIDIMNKSRSKVWLLKKKKTAIRELLPDQPVEFEIEHWWVIHVGFVTVEDVEKSTPLEHETIDLLIHKGPKLAGEIDKSAVYSLYRRNLIFLKVPIDDQDQIFVPPLEGFVMNRVQGDYFENLLYKIFVTIDERSTVSQLGNTLQIDLEEVKQAVSVYCLLGFAKKKNVEAVVDSSHSQSHGTSWHDSWLNIPTTSSSSSSALSNSGTTSSTSSAPKSLGPGSERKRIGFIFDSTLTAYLMMGNLAQGLKTYAVTLFEVGKLPEESLADFVGELEKVPETAEGEAQRYFDHAITLKHILLFLQSSSKDAFTGVDMVRGERLKDLDGKTRSRVLEKNYGLLLSVAPLSCEALSITSSLPPHYGPFIREMNTPWFLYYVYKRVQGAPPSVIIPKGEQLSSVPPEVVGFSSKILVWPWDREPDILYLNSITLTSINEALLSSAVLLQPYPQPEDDLVDFPLPFLSDSNTSSDSSSSGPELESGSGLQTGSDPPPSPFLGGVCDEDRKKIGRRVRDLVEQFPILRMTCGFLRFGKFKDEWFLFSVRFGFPLFSLKLCLEVCEASSRAHLLCSETVIEFSRSARALSLDLLLFIEETSCVDSETFFAALESSRVVLPPHFESFSQDDFCESQ